MRKRILAMCLVISMLMAMLCGCGKTETTAYSGKTDTKADKGMAVMGENVTYDPNHLVNDGKPVELDWWLWDTIFQKCFVAGVAAGSVKG